MSDMLNYFFGQAVSESELDLGFELLEQADRDLVSDVGIYGIISGAEPVPHHPVTDRSVDLTAPCRAYDRLGQRIYFATEQNVDCSMDTSGIPTAVHKAGNERWLAIFLKFDRLESDPRTDGNSQKVYFRRDESYQIIVRQGPEGADGAAPKVALEENALLVCDVRRMAGQTQIREVDIDVSRRQNFIFAEADAVEVVSGAWGAIQPEINTVQAAFDSVDEHLTGHVAGSSDRHTAADIDNTPRGFISAGNVQAAINEIVDGLSSALPDTAGAGLIGSDGEGGTPHALTTGNVRAQLGQLLTWINAHLNIASGAHNASAIASAAHAFLNSPSVQGQLQQLVDTLASQTSTPGAARIGNTQIEHGPVSITAGTVSDQLYSAIGQLSAHITSDGHVHNHDDDYPKVVRTFHGSIAANTIMAILGTIEVIPESISLAVKPASGPGPFPGIHYSGNFLKEVYVFVVNSESIEGQYDVMMSNATNYNCEYNLVLYKRDGYEIGISP